MIKIDDLPLQTRAVAYVYDGWAASYDRDVTDFSTYEAHRMVSAAARAFAPPSVSRILDLATGTGFVLQDLKTAFSAASLTGLDISRNMLDKAREKYLTRDLQQCDIESQIWPVENGAADIITCAGALSMIGNLDHLLDETARTLNKGGVASMSFFIRNDFRKGPMQLSEPNRFKTYARQPDEMAQALETRGFKLLAPIEPFTGFAGSTFRETLGLAAFTHG